MGVVVFVVVLDIILRSLRLLVFWSCLLLMLLMPQPFLFMGQRKKKCVFLCLRFSFAAFLHDDGGRGAYCNRLSLYYDGCNGEEGLA